MEHIPQTSIDKANSVHQTIQVKHADNQWAQIASTTFDHGNVELQNKIGAIPLKLADASSDSDGFKLMPYSLGKEETDAAKSPIKTESYDVNKPRGPLRGDDILDDVAQISGTFGGIFMANWHWSPKVNAENDFVAPSNFTLGDVSASTLDDFKIARRGAYSFLNVETRKLQDAAKNFNPNPAFRTDGEEEIAERLLAAKAARIQTSAIAENGNNPITRVDYSGLDASIKGHPRFDLVKKFQQSQNRLIDERNAKIATDEAKADIAHKELKSAAKFERNLNFGTVLGAEAAIFGIDRLTPRNRVSPMTSASDLIVPIATMGLQMTKLGKYEPLVKAGIMIGAHALFHLNLDEQVDESR